MLTNNILKNQQKKKRIIKTENFLRAHVKTEVLANKTVSMAKLEYLKCLLNLMRHFAAVAVVVLNHLN